MTQDEIIRMAREAGIQPVDRPRVERFAELVATAEREACAQVCDRLATKVDTYPSECAAAIRVRAEQKNPAAP